MNRTYWLFSQKTTALDARLHNIISLQKQQFDYINKLVLQMNIKINNKYKKKSFIQKNLIAKINMLEKKLIYQKSNKLIVKDFEIIKTRSIKLLEEANEGKILSHILEFCEEKEQKILLKEKKYINQFAQESIKNLYNEIALVAQEIGLIKESVAKNMIFQLNNIIINYQAVIQLFQTKSLDLKKLISHINAALIFCTVYCTFVLDVCYVHFDKLVSKVFSEYEEFSFNCMELYSATAIARRDGEMFRKKIAQKYHV